VQAVPVGQSLLWVRSLYISSGPVLSPRLEDVIVVYGSKSAIEPTVAGALADVLGGAVTGLGPTGLSSVTAPASSAVSLPVSAIVNDLIADANADLGTAQGELRQGDLSAYQADVVQAQVLLARAEQELTLPPVSPSRPGSHGLKAGPGSASKAGSSKAASAASPTTTTGSA
jgi:uncharacterized membrane protein (UPF0182 family)